MNPRVAILIVTYNAEKYIAATLQSCIQQSYKNCAIYILDNNSTDNTTSIIQNLNSSMVVLLFSKNNLGPYAGLNFLLDHLSGEEYIAIQDHDDIWFPSKIQQQVDFLEKKPEYVACGTQVYYYHENKCVLHLTDNFKINGYVDHTSLMFRNKGFRYDTSKSLPDEHLQAKVLCFSGRLGCLSIGLTIHRIRHDKMNLSSKRNRLNFRGAWEHLIYTRFRDFPGAVSNIISALLPEKLTWWSRRKYSYNNDSWISKEDFEQKQKIRL
jgi:glycosyltransferase involved in cell wall biosynthesis